MLSADAEVERGRVELFRDPDQRRPTRPPLPRLDEAIEDGWRGWLQLDKDGPSGPTTTTELVRQREGACHTRGKATQKRRKGAWSPEDYEKPPCCPNGSGRADPWRRVWGREGEANSERFP